MRAELLAMQSWQAQGGEILKWRERILNIEIDLFGRDQEGILWLIEVKGLSSGDPTWLSGRWQKQQRQRLWRASRSLMGTLRAEVWPCLALVQPDVEVTWIREIE